jgi:hypothetical protein
MSTHTWPGSSGGGVSPAGRRCHTGNRWEQPGGRGWGFLVSLAAVSLVVVVPGGAQQLPPWLSGVEWPKPPIVDPGPPDGPPSDAVVLFDGKDLSEWDAAEKWTIQDGYGTINAGVSTKRAFGDCQIHIEWASPPEVRGEGQRRGNSGVYIMGFYEVQILDSYDNETYYDGQAGAIYKQRPPLVNASRKPGEWQIYDIIFKAPRFDSDGRLLRPAYVTVLHNGVLIQNHFELLGRSDYRRPPHYAPHPEKLPLHLQYHGSPVRFRNIWVRELEDDREDLLAPLRQRLSPAATE